eukprot:366374-Chlamydomonas_euryale.AAC.4
MGERPGAQAHQPPAFCPLFPPRCVYARATQLDRSTTVDGIHWKAGSGLRNVRASRAARMYVTASRGNLGYPRTV